MGMRKRTTNSGTSTSSAADKNGASQRQGSNPNKSADDTAKTAPVAKIEAFEPSRRIQVSIRRVVNLGNYSSIHLEFFGDEYLKPGADRGKAYDALYDEIADKADEKAAEWEKIADENMAGEGTYENESNSDTGSVDDSDDNSSGGSDDDFGDDSGNQGDDLTEEAILKMSKKELAQLIKDEGIEKEVNIKEFKKIEDLRSAVIDALFEPDDNGESNDEWGDDDWGNDDDN